MTRRPALHRAGVSAAAAAAAIVQGACAATRATISFDEAGFAATACEELSPPPLLRAAGPAPRPVDVGPEVARVDAALMRASARLRSLRAASPAGAPPSAAAMETWFDLFAALDDFLGLPLDATPTLELVRANVTLEAELELDRRHYADLPADIGDGVRLRRDTVDRRLRLARRFPPPPRRPAAMAWPVTPPLLTSLYGERVDPLTGSWRSHQGVDIAADKGQLVTVAAAGIVVRAHRLGGHGLHVEVEHPGGEITRYSHLSMILTAPGAPVRRGDPIGLAGRSGRSTGPHLHFEVWRHGRPIDPLTVLSDPTSEFLPAEPPLPRPAAEPPGVGG